MTPGARLAAAISLLDEILGGEPAERSLTRWSRASRFAGSKDRAAVRDIVFDCIRQRRSFAWRSGAASGRGLVIAQQLPQAADFAALFSGDGFAPEPLTDLECAAIMCEVKPAPEPIAYDYPDFLQEEIARSLGVDRQVVLAAMQARAPLDLRVNMLRGTVAGAKVMLAQEGIAVEEHPLSPQALRVLENPRAVAGSRAYTSGLVELQDISSQAVALFAGAKPGMRVMDYCAGGGGKTLALAAQLGGQGLLMAHDINPGRMKDLPDRAARAGAKVALVATDDLTKLHGKCDLVLVDAPCSGSGAWRRNPDAKWRIDASGLELLLQVQAEILDRAAKLVAPLGRLVYATCSLLRCENADQITAFQARNPTWMLQDEAKFLPPNAGDGFYSAILG